MYHTRVYKPINSSKYVGNHTNIIMRSSWETRFAIWCDKNPNVIKWSSEETIVPYVSPVDKKIHRYFIDFKICIKNKDGVLKTYLVEIKPFSQTLPPVQPQRKTKRFLQESITWAINDSKWKAAKNYAKDRGWDFIVLTEKELGIK